MSAKTTKGRTRSSSRERRAKLSVASPEGKEKRTYKPSSSELNNEIRAILADQESLEWQQVYQKLEQDHKTWMLHDRRVAKYVKRQQHQIKQQASEQASPTGVSSWDRFFRRNSSSGNNKKQQSSPPLRNSVGLVNVGAQVPVTPLETPMMTTETPAAKTSNNKPSMSPSVVRDLKALYTDDNNGDKESGCLPCAAMKSN